MKAIHIEQRIIENMVDGYVECALWSTTDDDDSPMDDNYSETDIAPESLTEMREDCIAFVTDNYVDLAGMEPAQAGHDFWLTRNHHGAGFWDRGLGKRGDRLTKAAHAYGECDLYVGDDEKVYQA